FSEKSRGRRDASWRLARPDRRFSDAWLRSSERTLRVFVMLRRRGSSNPRGLGLITGLTVYWIPAFAGMTMAREWSKRIRKNLTRPGEVGRSVAPERYGVNEGDVDAHPGFKRPKLLELLAGLKRRRRQGHETRKRRAPISIDADGMIERPVAVGRRGPGEVKRAQGPRTERRADDLHHVGVGALLHPRD